MSARPKRKAVTDTETKAKKARGETDLKNDLKWTQAGKELKAGLSPLIILSSATLEGREKIAAFDVDFTVIQTASGRRFATGARDWEWWDECVPAKLKAIDKDGFRVVFFTNQAGIEKKKTKVEDITNKLEAIIKKLDIPVVAVICTGENQYRKPSTLGWQYFVENLNGGVDIVKSKCIYVGDAAGRPKNWAPGKSKDFSCTDRKFAANIGIKFNTPEEFFLGKKAVKFSWGSVDPKTIIAKFADSEEENPVYHKKEQELAIMVGPPACGKSTFRKKYLEPHGYVAVNRDTLGCMDRCIRKTLEHLREGKSVVVDNTNPGNDARRQYLSQAKKCGVPSRCFWMQTSFDLAHHLNLVRQTQTNGEVRRVPDVGYNMFKSQFEEPQKSEGFTEIIKVDFVPKFDSDKDKNLFLQWTG